MPIQGVRYNQSGNSVQGAFKIRDHENIPVSDTAATSSPIDSDIVFIVTSDFVRLAINVTANGSSPMIAPGCTALVIDRKDTLSFLSLDTSTSQATIIIPEG